MAGRTIWMLGLILLLFSAFELWVSPLSESRSQRALLEEFRGKAASPIPATPVAAVPGDPVGILSIPSLGLTAVVVEGVSAASLREGPGHLLGTPLPGQAGNAVVAGRRTTYGAPFANLARVDPGSLMVFTTLQGQFQFVVAHVLRVGPGQGDVLGASTDARLTLVTSDPAYMPSGRLVVIAQLHGNPLPPTVALPVSVYAGTTALGGDGGALAPTLLWAEVALAVILATFRLYRRRSLSRVAVYALTTPVVLASLFLLFGALDRLLPATL